MENELFEKAPIHTAYLKMALPVVMSMVIVLVYNMVDTYFIALTGNTHIIAAVSICAPLFMFLLAIADMFALGGSSVYSRLKGEGKVEEARHVSTFSFYTSFITGLVLSVIMILFKEPILHMLGTDANTYKYAEQYYTCLVTGSCIVIFSMVPSNLLRSEGKPIPSMFGTILGSVVNIILDPIFIFTLGLGAAGAAIATVLGYVASSLFFVIYIMRSDLNLSYSPKDFKFNKMIALSILAIGLPSSITNLMQSIGIAMTNRFLLPYGSDAIAVMGIVLKVTNIVLLVLIGLAFGGQPLFGYNYGAKNIKRLKKSMHFGMAVTAGTGLVLTVILYFLSAPVLHAFLNDTALISQGVTMLRFQIAGLTLYGIALIVICMFQSTGKALGAMILSLCRQGVIYFVALVILSATFKYQGVIAAQAASDVITLVVALFLYKIMLGNELNND